MTKKLRTTGEWTAELLDEYYQEIEKIAVEELQLKTYPNQLEIISSDQMLEAYSTHAMPVMYNHWKFGKDFVANKSAYDKGQMNLAYEVVINCLKYDTNVYVAGKGTILIKDICIGDYVYNGKEFVEVVNKTTSEKNTKTIRLDNGLSISATALHIFPVITDTGKQELELNSISIGDYLLVNNNAFEDTKTTAYLHDFEYFPPVNGYGEKFLYNPACELPLYMTPDLAELIGIILGDGCVAGNSRKIDIAVGWDTDGYHDYVVSLIKKVFDIDAKIYTRPSSKFPDKNNYIISICSNEIKHFLDYCGLKNGSTYKSKRIPWSVWRSNRECKARFLKGMFDTDGCIKLTNKKANTFSGISFSCYNEILGNDMLQLLLELGITSKCKRINNKYNNISSIEILGGGVKNFYNYITPEIKKKRDRLNLFVNSQQKYNSDSSSISKMPLYFKNKYGNNSGRKIFLEKIPLSVDDMYLKDFRTICILDITDDVEQESVVDITVKSNDNLFLANNILTHNCSPCIAYLMEENSIMMQALVMSHACFGHNAVFKNNYLFKDWTSAEFIIDYLSYAKKYVALCEEKYGVDNVEMFLDACHAIELYGVDKYRRKRNISTLEKETEKLKSLTFTDANYDDVLSQTIAKSKTKSKYNPFTAFKDMEPEENLLYFFEKKAPYLEDWQRELLRIVRKVAQYFHPQRQCITGENYISTKNGMERISDVISDEGYNENNIELLSVDNSFQNTSHFYKRKVSNTIRITTKLGRTLEGTPEHPIQILNDNLKFDMMSLRDIKVGMFATTKIGYTNSFAEFPYKFNFIRNDNLAENIECLICNKQYQNLSTHIPLHDMTVATYKNKFNIDKILSEKILKNRSKEITIPNNMTPSIARLYGYFVSEGCYSEKHGIVSIYNTDKDVIDDIIDIYKTEFNINPTVSMTTPQNCHHKVGWNVSVCNSIFKAFFNYCGFANEKANSKFIPKCIMQADEECIKNFISALYEGDECNAASGHIQYDSTSKELTNQLQLLLLNFGIVSKITSIPPNINFKHAQTQYRLKILPFFYNNFLNNIGFMSNRKNRNNREHFTMNMSSMYEVVPYIKKHINACKLKINDSKSKNKLFFRENLPYTSSDEFHLYSLLRDSKKIEYIKNIDEDLYYKIKNVIKEDNYYDEIINIEYLNDEKYVYDFTIPTNHLFISNGFVSHNTKLINEGFACHVHYTIMNRLYEKGLVDEGFMIEFLESHTAVTQQLPYTHPYYKHSGINVYSLGFRMFQDIKRICMEPTDEDREWFPNFAGNGKWVETCNWAMENFRDESFILQFLSPKLIRDYRMFAYEDLAMDEHITITDIHNKNGYQNIREKLAQMYDIQEILPNLQVTAVDPQTRELTITHISPNKIHLDEDDLSMVIAYIKQIWLFDARIVSETSDGEQFDEN